MEESRDMDEYKASELQALRAYNKLSFNSPSSIAQCSSRTMKQVAFASLQWQPGSTAQVLIPLGDAIWGKTAYLRCTFTTGSSADFGSGTILNIFKNVRTFHRTGVNTDNILNASLLGQIKRLYEYSETDRAILDGMLLPGGDSTPANGTYTCCVPLGLLGVGWAANSISEFSPPGMVAGGRLEFDIDTNANIFKGAVGTISNITLTLMADCSQLFDDVQKALLIDQSSATSSGLQFTYSSYYSTQMPIGASASTALSMDVLFSASMCKKVFFAAVPTLSAAQDNFHFPGSQWLQWQSRLGALYMPQQIVYQSSAGVGTSSESYNLAVQAMEAAPRQFTMRQVGGTSVSAFGALNANNGWDTDYGLIAVSLERSPVGLELSGSPTNNSQIINLTAQLNTTLTNQTGCVIYAFVEHVRVLNLLGSNAVLDL